MKRTEQICRVLVVEDNIDLCTVFRVLLRNVCDFHIEHTLADAIAYLADHKINVLFLDNNLPDGMGIPLIAKIREMHPNATIVIMTADTTEGLADQALAEGATQFIRKPFGGAVIRDIVGASPAQ